MALHTIACAFFYQYFVPDGTQKRTNLYMVAGELLPDLKIRERRSGVMEEGNAVSYYIIANIGEPVFLRRNRFV